MKKLLFVLVLIFIILVSCKFVKKPNNINFDNTSIDSNNIELPVCDSIQKSNDNFCVEAAAASSVML